ncbi:RluA family pseudouridine synthase [Zavarzinia compransoris]|uniref:RNA pseudouridine synthase n=1 Tax=Zavarzinia compransoris TaxID=1264899 RepID=A0A317E0L8_9PROT|nr:RNA pseudouridine synthase [Zavarzinia compransoris]PWR20617.1 RNA pseudouridine synthase [Zavarzinia compransoris]TDP44567.1 tRNA pseudouridine32 synthase/23S rRNA pseudouridine746 synthase/23S rRNA pseudouridine1911/1915/1917 synthase [Zavarzinia compransoris]
MPRPAERKAPDAAEIEARVLYKDSLVLIIDKPAGLPVHQGPGGGPNLEQSFIHLRYGLPRAPSLAHRLDRDTTGCLVLGRHPKALTKLGKIFAGGRAKKTYWAVVRGRPAADQGTVEAPLAKLTPKRGWRMVIDPAGQPAVTDYRVLGTSADGAHAWLELHPRTGRTHQIRVHCAHLGCPLVGEPIYGRPEDAPEPEDVLHLLARAIQLPLYPSREPVEATAPPPDHMLPLLRACGYRD